MEESVIPRDALPTGAEIADADEFLRSHEFLRFIMDADAITRFYRVNHPERGSWLRTAALNLLVRRGGTMTHSQLAGPLLRANESVTRLVDELERDGLASRRRSKRDRRSVDIVITRAGINTLRDQLTHLEELGEPIIRGLTDADMQYVVAISRVVRASVAEQLGLADSHSHYARGLGYVMLGHEDLARADFERCLELGPKADLRERALAAIAGLDSGVTSS